MLWLSPAFPVGSFAYSQGLEWAVESGDIQDARSLGGWLVDLLTFGAPRADALLFADCFRAAMAEDWEALAEANELAIPLANSAERRPRRSRRLGLRAPASAFPGGARGLSGGGRLGECGSRVAARSEPSGLPFGPDRRRRLCCRAPWADWPDRRPEDPGDAPPSHTRACP